MESTENSKVLDEVKTYFILVFVVQFQGTNWKLDQWLLHSTTRGHQATSTELAWPEVQFTAVVIQIAVPT